MTLISKHINYLEFKCNDLKVTKEFYSTLFDWEFTDYGETYTAFCNSGIDGGFELTTDKIEKGALCVLYHENLEEIISQIESAGGKISKDIFAFPGGKRFHFIDPSGNELAVWSEQ